MGIRMISFEGSISMKRIGLLLLLVGFLFGCSNIEAGSTQEDAEVNEDLETSNLRKEIEQVRNENQLLKDKIQNFSSNIQNLDHQSRNIVELIEKGDLDSIKTEYGVNIRISEANDVIVEGDENTLEGPYYITTDLASLPMSFVYYNPQPESLEIGYHVYGGEEGQEFKRTISFMYDLDFKLTSIYSVE
jgi:cell division protein FtsB